MKFRSHTRRCSREKVLAVQHDGDRPVIHQLHLHIGAEKAAENPVGKDPAGKFPARFLKPGG